MVCWMDSSAALTPRKMYALKHTTRNVRAMVTDLRYRLDINTMHRDQDATQLVAQRDRPRRAAHHRAGLRRRLSPQPRRPAASC